MRRPVCSDAIVESPRLIRFPSSHIGAAPFSHRQSLPHCIRLDLRDPNPLFNHRTYPLWATVALRTLPGAGDTTVLVAKPKKRLALEHGESGRVLRLVVR